MNETALLGAGATGLMKLSEGRFHVILGPSAAAEAEALKARLR